MNPPIVEFREVSKSFENCLANQSLSFSVEENSFHGLVGENGAGKSTAMKLLFGLHLPDSGTIFFRNEPIHFRSPKDAISKRIGMVHQHFNLVPSLAVWENIVLGEEPQRSFLNKSDIFKSLDSLQAEYGFKLDLKALVEHLSLGEQQQVEILKTLYRKVDLLILDEPTAVLSPHEVILLFKRLRNLVSSGKTVIVITHKLKEVLAYTDHVTVMRQGQVVKTTPTSLLTETQLSQLIMGKERQGLKKRPIHSFSESILEMSSVSTRLPQTINLRDMGFNVKKGEIVGVAGIEGNGQEELVKVLSQLIPFEGTIQLLNKPLKDLSFYEWRQRGFSFIPPDRLRDGLIADFTNAENLILGHHFSSDYQEKGLFKAAAVKRTAQNRMDRFEIRPNSIEMLSRYLSGGNQQKLLLAREESVHTSFFLACHPTRGVDIGASDFIHKYLLQAANQGAGILLVSSDLDELFSLSDRILVLRGGSIVFETKTDQCSVETLGLQMTGVNP